jgi:hypothetical protein
VIRIGHKGAAALAPENTLRSIERAIEVGVDMVEIDVLTLNDGTLVLAHSNDLLEVSHGAASGTVTTQSLAELGRVAPELPTLDEALALLAGHSAGIFLDLNVAPDVAAADRPAARGRGRHCGHAPLPRRLRRGRPALPHVRGRRLCVDRGRSERLPAPGRPRRRRYRHERSTDFCR